MADIAVLQAACVAAETAKSELLAKRAEKRGKVSVAAFKEYNEATRAEQLAVQAAVTAADKAFKAGLDTVRSDAVTQVIDVGTLNEGNKIGSVNS